MQIKLIPLNAGFDPSSVVRDPVPVIEKTGKFSDEGVFSERIFGRMPSSGREYACDCGEIEGRFYEGAECPSCGTKVTCRDTVFSKRGWIDLGDHQVLSPLFYVYFAKVTGPSQLVKILSQKRSLTVDGIAKSDSSSGPFDGIGLTQFGERWPEILDHFEAKKKSDPRVAEYARVIRENPDKVMTSKIPVFSHILRPALVVDRQLIFDEVNNLYNLAISNAQVLREYTESEATESNINAVLWRIQERVNEVFDHVLHILSGKGGYLRGSLLGVRVNFSARCVITPLSPGHEQDEVVIPYLTFLELYRFQLTNLIARMNGVNLSKANEIWSKAQTKFDRSVFAAMKEMIRLSDGQGLPALLNRNPTIAFGSVLRVRITGIKRDPKDFTMSLHNGVLRLLGGDYDGDVLSLVPLIDADLAEAFRIFDPRLMFVSRDAPGLNKAMKLDKDHALGISVLTEDPLHAFSVR